MEKRFWAEPFKCVASLLCCACFLALGGGMLTIERWGSAAVFLALGLVFALVGILCGAVIEVGPGGVRRTILGRKAGQFRWAEVAEVGVVGTRVFHRRDPDKVGSLYIYFSRTAMTEEERFDMLVKWPPLKKIYLAYDPIRMSAIQALWSDKIQTYNVGKLAK